MDRPWVLRMMRLPDTCGRLDISAQDANEVYDYVKELERLVARHRAAVKTYRDLRDKGLLSTPGGYAALATVMQE